jgi:predicted HTH domain antitoxin
MKMISVEIPDDMPLELAATDEDLARELRLAAAIFWYDQGLVSQGKGAEIAGLSRREFIEALGRAEVDAIQITDEELKEEVQRDLQARRERVASHISDARRAP